MGARNIDINYYRFDMQGFIVLCLLVATNAAPVQELLKDVNNNQALNIINNCIINNVNVNSFNGNNKSPSQEYQELVNKIPDGELKEALSGIENNQALNIINNCIINNVNVNSFNENEYSPQAQGAQYEGK